MPRRRGHEPGRVGRGSAPEPEGGPRALLRGRSSSGSRRAPDHRVGRSRCVSPRLPVVSGADAIRARRPDSWRRISTPSSAAPRLRVAQPGSGHGEFHRWPASQFGVQREYGLPVARAPNCSYSSQFFSRTSLRVPSWRSSPTPRRCRFDNMLCGPAGPFGLDSGCGVSGVVDLPPSASFGRGVAVLRGL